MRTVGRVLTPQVAMSRALDQNYTKREDARAEILPCKVVSQSGFRVSVQVLVESDKPIPTIEGVPVLTAKHIYYPIDAGDLGVLIPADVFLDNAMDSATPTDGGLRPGNLSGYMFLPLPKTGQTANDLAATCVDGAGGAYLLKVGDSDVSIQKADGSTTVKVSGSDVHIKAGGRDVSMSGLWSYLDGMQSAYNANFSGLSLPPYTGTF